MKRTVLSVVVLLAFGLAWADSITAITPRIYPGLTNPDRCKEESRPQPITQYTAGDAQGMTPYFVMIPEVSYGNTLDIPGEFFIMTDVGKFFFTESPGGAIFNWKWLDDQLHTHMGPFEVGETFPMEVVEFFPPGDYTLRREGVAITVDSAQNGVPFAAEAKFTVVPGEYDIATALGLEEAVRNGLIVIDTTSRGTSPHGWQAAFNKAKNRVYALNGLCGVSQSSTLTIKALRPVRLTGSSAVVAGELTWHSTELPRDRPLASSFAITLPKAGSEATFTFTRDNSPLYLSHEHSSEELHALGVIKLFKKQQPLPRAEVYDCKVVDLGKNAEIPSPVDDDDIDVTVVTNINRHVETIAEEEEELHSVSLSATGDPNCLLSGQGKYPVNNRVKIRAVASDDWSFNGWYQGDRLVSSNAKYEFRMPAEDLSFVARFTRYEPPVIKLFLESDDMPRTEVPTQADNLVLDVKSAVCWRLVVEANVKTSLTIESLPRGLVYNRYNSTIMGTPFRPGLYKVNCWVNESGAKGKTHLRSFTINADVPPPANLLRGDEPQAVEKKEPETIRFRTDANEYFKTPLPNGPTDQPVCLKVGVDVEKTFPSLRVKDGYPDDLSVRIGGLPYGMKCDSRRKLIVGAPKRAGRYVITLTVDDPEENTRKVSTFPVTVEK